MEERHDSAALLQMSRRDIGVAAIVARPAEHNEAQSSWMKAQGRSRSRRTCPFHQAKRIDTGCGSGRVDGGHLGRREKKVGQLVAHWPIQIKKRLKNNRQKHQRKEPILCICLYFNLRDA
jgi:hypothetical protein